MLKRMKYVAIVACMCISIGMMAQDDSNATYRYKVDVGQFTKLRVIDDVNVIYRCVPDSTGKVVYEGGDEFADAFIFSRSGEMLKVQVNTDDVGKPHLPTLYIYSDFLTWVENTSNFTVTVETLSPCPEFEARQVGNGVLNVQGIKSNKVKAVLNTGNGTVNVSGECQQEQITLIGVGTVQSDLLKAEQVTVRAVGPGTIGCFPLQSLKVNGLGKCKVYYKGNPQIKNKGNSKLFQLPEGMNIYSKISD